MFRKSIFFMLFVCLLAASNYSLAYNWAPTTTWHGDADANWFNAANWYVSDTEPNTVPDITYNALMEPKFANPIIEGAAATGYLNIMPWSWAYATGENGEWGVDMVAGTFDCNYGISIGAWGTYENQTDTTYGIPRLRIYGGTVVQTNGTTAPDGILIGGGDSGYRTLFGKLYMYGGNLYARRLELRFGEIDLFGGVLDCCDGNFIFYQNRPKNKINVNGGTLRVAGNHTTDFSTLITNKRIVCLRGGTLGSPVYDSNTGYTTITGTGDMNVAWNPTPETGAVNIHYRNPATDLNVPVLLSWSPGDGNVEAHSVYFGTSSAAVLAATTASPEFVQTLGQDINEPCEINIIYPFVIAGTYYWRVDEEVNDVCEATGIGTWTTFKGKVWSFTAHDGRSYNSKPINGAQALNQPFALSWSAGDFASKTNGHKIYFTTEAGGGNLVNTAFPRPTDNRYLGQQTTPYYSLTSLSAKGWTLVPGNTYYWCVDEVNTTSGVSWKQSNLFKFTVAAYMNIDDFEDYNSFADVNANWLTGYETCPIAELGGMLLTNIGSTLGFVNDASGKYLQMTYTNAAARYFSETKRNYAMGTSFTGGTVLTQKLAALAFSFRGFETNPVEPTYDRMYVAIEDTAGHVGVIYNPDDQAQRNTQWTQWFIGLPEFNAQGVDMNYVKNFFVGMGQRCNWTINGGGDGNVMFDTIRLYSQTCNPGYAQSQGLTSDFDGDCDVDVNDLDVFADYWLNHADDLTYSPITAPATPVLWYKFDDSGVLAECADSSGNGYTGTVTNMVPTNWNLTGGRSGGPCLAIPITNPTGTASVQTYIDAPVAALNFLSDGAHTTPISVPGYSGPDGGGVTFSVWANASLGGDFLYQWPGIFGVWDATGETLEVHCPSRLGPGQSPAGQGLLHFIKREGDGTPSIAANATRPLVDFGGRWNHWAFVKSPNSIKAYLNGVIVGRVDANDLEGDPNVYVHGPLVPVPATRIKIGTRGDNWAMWSGKLADFKIYNYALTDAEVQYLATDGTGHLVLPLTIPENLENSGAAGQQRIDLRDLAKMVDKWHQQILWP